MSFSAKAPVQKFLSLTAIPFNEAKSQAHSMCRSPQKAELFESQRTALGECLLLLERYLV
jgi:hypothetical protein